MQFGLFSLLRRRDKPCGIAGLIDHATETVQLADQAGFAWVPEHHFTNGSLSVLPDEAPPEDCRDSVVVGDPHYGARRGVEFIRVLDPVPLHLLLPSRRHAGRACPVLVRTVRAEVLPLVEREVGPLDRICLHRLRRRHASVPPDRGAFIRRAAGNRRRDNQSRHT